MSWHTTLPCDVQRPTPEASCQGCRQVLYLDFVWFQRNVRGCDFQWRIQSGHRRTDGAQLHSADCAGGLEPRPVAGDLQIYFGSAIGAECGGWNPDGTGELQQPLYLRIALKREAIARMRDPSSRHCLCRSSQCYVERSNIQMSFGGGLNNFATSWES